MKKLLLMTITLTMLALINSGCKQKKTKPPEEVKKIEDIKIGAIQPLTGDVASWGQHGERAMAIALEEINSTGGIHGRPLKLILEDSKGDPKVGVNALNKLIDIDKVPIIIGDAISPVSLSTAPIASKRHVVLLSPGSTAAILTEVGGDFFFRIMPSDSLQSRITADWIINSGYKKVAIIGSNNIWGHGLVRYFEKFYKEKNGQIVFQELVDDKTFDFRTIIGKILASKPEAIYAPLYQSQAGSFLRQLKELGYKIQVFGADVWEAPELLETAGTSADGVLFTTFVHKDNEISRDFRAKYREKYGLDPINYSYFAYDALILASKAVNQAGYDADKIRVFLLNTKNFQGTTGITSFDENGDVTTKTFEKMTIKEGKIVPWQSK